ncbi:replication initiation protein, RepL2 [Streptomyces violascens]|uniref:replication initiation protein, RepL2 n=1 Tax=Streptomyces violascens TaxID=67381 RepID=UPI0036959B9A
MRIHDSEDVRYLLQRSAKELSHGQRLVVMLYVASEQRADGAVLERASDMAATLGMTGPGFYRSRKELTGKGWLEEAGKFGSAKAFRISRGIGRERTGGHLRVVGE